MVEFGKLFVVATPIGNLADISQRAIQLLGEVDLIAAEDTRHSAKLLKHYLINTPMLALYEHNEIKATEKLLAKLKAGQDIALISDAGTPAICDPGYRLINILRENGVTIISVPGPCALVAALSIAGMSVSQFRFEGFLSAKLTQREQQLEGLQHESSTLVFYEAPHRIRQSLRSMLMVFGSERRVVLAHELTKIHEEVIVKPLGELVKLVEQQSALHQGEYVVIVAGSEVQKSSDILAHEHLLKCLLAELPLKQAVSLAVKITGCKKNPLYELALTLQKS